MADGNTHKEIPMGSIDQKISVGAMDHPKLNIGSNTIVKKDQVPVITADVSAATLNPFIGPNGKSNDTLAGLDAAQTQANKSDKMFKSAVTGEDYESFEVMKQAEHAWKVQNVQEIVKKPLE